MHDTLTARFLDRQDWLTACLRRAFPCAPRADIEDALQDMWVDLSTSAIPLPLDQARLDGLMRCVAWRRLRARYRRLGATLEIPMLEEAGHTPPSQELMAERWRWPALFGRVVSTHGGQAPDALAAALVEKLYTHDTDAAVALRHGVTRERLNGAWNALLEAMLPRARRRSRR